MMRTIATALPPLMVPMNAARSSRMPVCHYEQAHEEEEGLVVHPFQDVQGVAPGGEEGEQGHHGADEGHGEAGVGVGNQQNHGHQEHHPAQGEGTLILDGSLGVQDGAGSQLFWVDAGGPELFVVH